MMQFHREGQRESRRRVWWKGAMQRGDMHSRWMGIVCREHEGSGAMHRYGNVVQ
jgi:hypothetical protein